MHATAQAAGALVSVTFVLAPRVPMYTTPNAPWPRRGPSVMSSACADAVVTDTSRKTVGDKRRNDHLEHHVKPVHLLHDLVPECLHDRL